MNSLLALPLEAVLADPPRANTMPVKTADLPDPLAPLKKLSL